MLTEKRITKGQGKVALSGELTIYSAAELKTALEKYIDSTKCRSLTIDLSEITEIDTPCIQILMQLKQEFRNSKRELKLISHSHAVIEVFDLYNLGSFFGDAVVLAN